MPDKYIYLTGSLITLLLVAIIFVIRKDLRKFIIKAGVLGGVLGVVSEFWYFQDYWHPPSTLGVAVISPDDFIFGFAFVALGATIIPLIRRQPFVSSRGGWKQIAIPTLVFGLIMLLVFTNLLHFNSLIITTIIPLAVVVYVIIRERSLWKRAVFGAVCMGLYALLLYAIVIGILSPHYFEKYYLFFGQSWNPTVFGIMPLVELCWYMSIGAVSAVSFEYIVRHKLAKTDTK